MIRSIDERLHEKIDTSGGASACHPWLGHFGQWGVPCLSVKKTAISARRRLWESERGVLPKNRLVYTTCGRKDCMNLAHLTLEPVDDPVPRFWKNVHRASGDACWEWKATRKMHTACSARGGTGYGHFMVSDAKRVQAHRYSYELHFGPIPEGMFVMHKCDNPPCVRPDHLELGTPKDNMQDAIRKGRNSRGPEHGLKAVAGRRTPRAPTPRRPEYFRLNPESIAAVAADYRAGLRRTALARKHGMGRSTVYRALVKAGVIVPTETGSVTK